MAAWLPNYSHRRRITINRANVGANLTNFPVLVRLTTTNFTFTNTTTTGNDIRFTTSDGTTLLDYERERHDRPGSRAEYWVRVPTVLGTGTVDTFIFIYFRDDPTIPDGANPTAVWGANFRARFGMGDLTTSTIRDSTINANNGTKLAANEPIEVEGRIGRAQSFDGINDRISIPTGTLHNFGTGEFTISFWLRTTDTGGIVYDYRPSSTIDQIHQVQTAPSPNFIGFRTGATFLMAGVNVLDGVWRQIVCRRTTTGREIYINGNFVISDTVIHDLHGYSSLWLGVEGGTGTFLNGEIDEFLVSNIARSPAWIRADYHSGNDTLLIYGGQENLLILAETFSITDTITKTPQKNLLEIFTISDSISVAKVISRTFAEVITITDSISKGIIKAFTETFTIIDTITKTISKVFSEVVSIIDTITALRVITRTFAEVIGITDAIRKEIRKAFSEIISITDTISVARIRQIFLTDVFTITDAIGKTITKMFREVFTIIDRIKIPFFYRDKYMRQNNIYEEKYR